MIQEVESRLVERLFVCDICGHSSPSKESSSLVSCARTMPEQWPVIQKGDVVKIFWTRPDGQWRKLTEAPEEFTVKETFYTQPLDSRLDLWSRDAQPLHTFVLELARNLDGTLYAEGSKGYALLRLSYPDFLLWQKGDPIALQAAGLFHPRPARNRLIAWLLGLFE